MESTVKPGDVCRFKRHPAMTPGEWDVLVSKIVVVGNPSGYTIHGKLCFAISPRIRLPKPNGGTRVITNAAGFVLRPIRPGDEDDETFEWAGKPKVEEKDWSLA